MFTLFLLLAVQIIIESLPISSSGHYALMQKLCAQLGYHVPSSLPMLYELVQAPTIAIIILFFYSRWAFVLLAWRRTWHIIAKIIGLTLVADIITCLFYILFWHYAWLRIPLALGFCITACILYSLRYAPRKKTTPWNMRTACILGVVQGIALQPGISRMATTFAAGCWLGLGRYTAFEVSFLIQLPLITAACALAALKVWLSGQPLTELTQPLLCVVGISSLVAYALLCCVARRAYNGTLWRMAWYMIVPVTLALIV